ncbi:hypothetical protein [Deinococcus sp.]|uniref:hypothetical protein n=1 Tax=Deinococcus sp. TaxID=47478 RepID=UPI0025DFC0D4|nr:hypothetical protein [Deinococcus sp.]
MKCAGLKRSGLLTLALLGAAALPTAGAQNLDAYRQMKGALNQAVQDRPFSKARSLADLETAQQALERLKPTIRSLPLAQGLEDSLSASRAALARTPADLEAQITQARGLMRAVLYGQTTAQLATAPAAAQDQSRVLAEEFGLSGNGAAAFLKSASSGNAAQAGRLLQQAAARKVQGYLGAVNLTDRQAAYLNLTRAASWFTAVQDAPGASNVQSAQFAGALSALTGGDLTGARSNLQALRSGAANFVRVSQGAAPLNVPGSTVVAPTDGGVPAPPSNTQPDPAVPPTSQPPTNTGSAGNGNTSIGNTSIGNTDAVYAALGRALAAASVADQPGARAALSAASQALGQARALGSAAGYGSLVSDISAAGVRSGLRPSDVQSLIGELRNTEAQATAQPGSALRSSSADVSRSFGGGLRAIIFLLLSALAVYPLHLLNLAFGNRNPYWRMVLAGLICLLLPALLEGLAGFLGFVGDLANLGALRSLGNLTLTQNALGGPVWVLSLAAALAALTYGFRGLCVQFGLLGTAKPSVNETHSSLEWDEEL